MKTSQYKRALVRIRRSLVAVLLIAWTHAIVAAGFLLVMFGSTPEARLIGGVLIGFIVTVAGVSTGALIVFRVHKNQPPLPATHELDHTISGKPGSPADDELGYDEVAEQSMIDQVNDLFGASQSPSSSMRFAENGDTLR